MAISLIVGLGNPGINYSKHRHNVGFWFLDLLAASEKLGFKLETKFAANICNITINNKVILLKPNVFMNNSGTSVRNITNFYKINSNQILVVHDDLDLDVGVAKIKKGGGHGGHNGLKDIINKLASNDFYRLRIGIGHPGDSKKVTNYVLNKPNKTEKIMIDNVIARSLTIIDDIVSSDFEKVMNILHSPF